MAKLTAKQLEALTTADDGRIIREDGGLVAKVLGIGLAPLLERQALLGAGMAGLQQRHPLRRFVEDAFSPSLAHSASTW